MNSTNIFMQLFAAWPHDDGAVC